jgi:hypothetical protein
MVQAAAGGHNPRPIRRGLGSYRRLINARQSLWFQASRSLLGPARFRLSEPYTKVPLARLRRELSCPVGRRRRWPTQDDVAIVLAEPAHGRETVDGGRLDADQALALRVRLALVARAAARW